jgi:adenylyltransferase/sulfurtransferase
MVKEITVQQLNDMVNKSESFLLIDVREPHEHETKNIGGTLIPLGEIPAQIGAIDAEKQVVVYCRSGKRSANAIVHIQEVAGLENLYNLKGGILAWVDEIEDSE